MTTSSSGKVRVDLSGTEGPWVAHWIDIDAGEWGPTQEVAGGKNARLAPPGQGNWVAAILIEE